jgi:hypothetical protein
VEWADDGLYVHDYYGQNKAELQQKPWKPQAKYVEKAAKHRLNAASRKRNLKER